MEKINKKKMVNTKVIYVAISEKKAIGSFLKLEDASKYLESIGFTKKDQNNTNRFLFYADLEVFAEIQETKLNISFKKQTFKY